MPVLRSQIDTRSPEFRENESHHRQLAEELHQRLQRAAEGGGEKARQRHVERGKLPVRERIDALLDPGSPFLEIAPLAAEDMYDGAAPAAGMVCGIGRVMGQEVVVVANDATVKGGSYFPMTVKKHLRAQEIARENRLPCIYLVDSGGAFLPLQDEVFPDKEHFGRIFYKWFTTAPVGAISSLLDKVGWKVDDVDLFEINEAFAVVAMAPIRDLGIPHQKLNVNGGACALGHPIGATGARLVVTLVNALRKRGLKRGIAALCIGGGEATAIALEMV